jgi:hypothetical protein
VSTVLYLSDVQRRGTCEARGRRWTLIESELMEERNGEESVRSLNYIQHSRIGGCITRDARDGLFCLFPRP